MGLVSVSFADTRIVDFDLIDLDEKSFLVNNKPTILALGNKNIPFDETRPPVLLVHGIRGKPADLQSIVDSLKNSQYQLYVLAYNDFKRKVSANGKDLAILLKEFKARKKLTIVAHSMGGIVVRKALGDLSESDDIQEFESIRFISIDSPWHGFDGPEDGSMKMKVASPFLPDGLEDMRARSKFLRNLYVNKLPTNIEVNLLFASEGDEAFGPSEIEGKAVIKEQITHFESAISMTTEELRVFTGEHTSVLNNPELLQFLGEKIK
jgi:pimeloyl-ACP methyl ester carboxylesterase